MSTTVRIEIRKSPLRPWETYNSRTVSGKGSNAKTSAKKLARELRKTTMGTMRIRVVAAGEDWQETTWDSLWSPS